MTYPPYHDTVSVDPPTSLYGGGSENDPLNTLYVVPGYSPHAATEEPGSRFPYLRGLEIQLVPNTGAIETEYRDLGAAIERGQPYPMDNGYSFVIDHRPQGHEDDHIPADEYTAYFANRQIPIAAGWLRSHDMGHARDYLRIFKDPLCADVIAGAAGNAQGDSERCRQFTRAMDKFGDALFIVAFFGENGAAGPLDGVSMARHNLRRLVSLFTGEPLDVTPPAGNTTATPNNSEVIYRELWKRLGLSKYDNRARPERFLPLKVTPQDSRRTPSGSGYVSIGGEERLYYTEPPRRYYEQNELGLDYPIK